MKSHEKLGITFAEFGALLGTKALLEQNTLKHQDYNASAGYDRWIVPVPGEHVFNMNVGCKAKECGTVSCIGGTMALIMGMAENEAANYVDGGRSDPLGPLFYPNTSLPKGCSVNYHTITPKQAVVAIDNFLKTGKPKWHEIVEVTRFLPFSHL